jgi:2-phosphosulfolactate phosphatase
MTSLEVFFTPAEFATLPNRDLSDTTCVVFDVLRATSTMITALGNGAQAILPVEEISEALAARRQRPDVLLAGERDGLRIGPDLARGATFDLGNSPREFASSVVKGKTIVMTTTNGTRALNACRGARQTFAGSFLNLEATAETVARSPSASILVVCSGTMDQTAFEDVLGAGALCDLLWVRHQEGSVADSAFMARELYLKSQADLLRVASTSRNARRLMSRPELRDDVPFCLQRDIQPLVATLGKDGFVTRLQQPNY